MAGNTLHAKAAEVGSTGGGNKLVITDKVKNHNETAQSSTFDGKKVIMQAGHDARISGSNVISDNGTYIQADNNVQIDTTQTHSQSETYHQTQKSGLMSAGIGFTVGTKKEASENQSQRTEHTGSTVGSLKGDTTIVAGKKYTQIGSNVSSPEGNNLIAAQSIDIEAAQNRFDSTSVQTYEQKGLTVAFSSPVTDLAQQINSVAQSGKQVGQSKNDRVNAMAAANTGWQAYQAGKSAQNVAADPKKAAKQVSVSITYGEQKNRQTTQAQATEAQASQTLAGGTTTLIATGAGKQSHINIKGSDVAGKAGTVLIADGPINLQSAEQTGSERSKNKSEGWNAGVAVSFGQNGLAFGFTAGGNHGKGYGNGDDVTHRHTHIGDKDSRTVIQSSGDTTLKGAQVKGKGVALSTRNLNIESIQDSAVYRSKQQNLSGSVTVGYGASATAGYNQSKTNADHRSISEQSGIFAGDDGFQVNVANHTDLKGGIITATETAESEGRNRFRTASISHSDIENHSRYEGDGFGIGVSGSISGQSLGQTAPAADSRIQTVAAKNGIDSSIGYGSDGGSQSSVTKSGIGTRNIIIGNDTDGTQAAAAYTATRTETAEADSGRLNNIFDKERVQNEIDLQRKVSQEFSKNVQSANSEINQKLDTLKEQKEKGLISEAEYRQKAGNWQKGKVLLNSIAAGLSAPTQSTAGIAAAAASPAVSYQIGQHFKELAQQNSDGKLTAKQETAHI